MIIVIDTSEQKPFFAGRNAPKGVLTVRDNLKPQGGDYSLQGFENEIIIERKEANDFLTSITSDYERFSKTFDKLRSHAVRYIMVEKSFHDILDMCDSVAFGNSRKKYKGGVISAVKCPDKRAIHPNTVIGRVQSIIGEASNSNMVCR